MAAVTVDSVGTCHRGVVDRPHLWTVPSHVRPRVSAVHRRRRLVALAVLVALGFLLRWALATSGPASSSSLPTMSGPVHVVQPGETLWEIARAVQPDGDIRPLVDRLAAERGNRPLQVGEKVHAR